MFIAAVCVILLIKLDGLRVRVYTTCSFLCYQGKGYCFCCIIYRFVLQSQTASGKLQACSEILGVKVQVNCRSVLGTVLYLLFPSLLTIYTIYH